MTAENGNSKSVRFGRINVEITLEYVDGKPTSALLVTDADAPGVAGLVKHIPGAWDSDEQAFNEVEPKALEWAQRLSSSK